MDVADGCFDKESRVSELYKEIGRLKIQLLTCGGGGGSPSAQRERIQERLKDQVAELQRLREAAPAPAAAPDVHLPSSTELPEESSVPCVPSEEVAPRKLVTDDHLQESVDGATSSVDGVHTEHGGAVGNTVAPESAIDSSSPKCVRSNSDKTRRRRSADALHLRRPWGSSAPAKSQLRSYASSNESHVTVAAPVEVADDTQEGDRHSAAEPLRVSVAKGDRKLQRSRSDNTRKKITACALHLRRPWGSSAPVKASPRSVSSILSSEIAVSSPRMVTVAGSSHRPGHPCPAQQSASRPCASQSLKRNAHVTLCEHSALERQARRLGESLLEVQARCHRLERAEGERRRADIAVRASRRALSVDRDISVSFGPLRSATAQSTGADCDDQAQSERAQSSTCPIESVTKSAKYSTASSYGFRGSRLGPGTSCRLRSPRHVARIVAHPDVSAQNAPSVSSTGLEDVPAADDCEVVVERKGSFVWRQFSGVLSSATSGAESQDAVRVSDEAEIDAVSVEVSSVVPLASNVVDGCGDVGAGPLCIVTTPTTPANGGGRVAANSGGASPANAAVGGEAAESSLGGCFCLETASGCRIVADSPRILPPGQTRLGDQTSVRGPLLGADDEAPLVSSSVPSQSCVVDRMATQAAEDGEVCAPANVAATSTKSKDSREHSPLELKQISTNAEHPQQIVSSPTCDVHNVEGISDLRTRCDNTEETQHSEDTDRMLPTGSVTSIGGSCDAGCSNVTQLGGSGPSPLVRLWSPPNPVRKGGDSDSDGGDSPAGCDSTALLATPSSWEVPAGITHPGGDAAGGAAAFSCEAPSSPQLADVSDAMSLEQPSSEAAPAPVRVASGPLPRGRGVLAPAAPGADAGGGRCNQEGEHEQEFEAASAATIAAPLAQAQSVASGRGIGWSDAPRSSWPKGGAADVFARLSGTHTKSSQARHSKVAREEALLPGAGQRT
eukprot:TRINITY_DN1485_c0_g1_i4.p1 TRINITY_DN1485_c0_g1~~TRINITY_DN1485_c0_g1_i4.p1  ORF type:complete len:971 (-),score=110.72 TRINITY_DN1485_c0_g1_i4:82-2949(-)